MALIDRNATVAEIVTAHPETALVFQRHGIDFCCRGGVPVPEACNGKAVEPAKLFDELERTVSRGQQRVEEDPRDQSTPALIARIVGTHHEFLRQTLPVLQPLANKVASVHGTHEPRLAPLRDVLARIAEMLAPHLDDEEQVLFPALMSRAPDATIVRAELAKMHEDHLAVGSKLAELRLLADGFTTPEWGCASYRALMSGLEALELDILRHVHLENHVLMPRFAAQRAVA